MQFGQLDSGDQSTFKTRQAALTRNPTWVVWISGLGDLTDYVKEIDTETAIESARGRGRLNVGTAIITASNTSNLFYSGGVSSVSRIQKNARMKIWAGFGDLNIPIFTGVVLDARPLLDSNLVELFCVDYMGLLRDLRVDGHQGSNNTIKLIAESFASDAGASSNIPSNDETNEVLTRPTFESQKTISALEELMDAIFSVALFDENGSMQVYEREFANPTDFVFTNDNILEEGATDLAPREIINRVEVEYREDFLSKNYDQQSIDQYRERKRKIRVPFLNYILVSEQTTGTTEEILDNDLEGFKFTSAADAANIDTIAVKLKQDSGSGSVSIRIYSDSTGSPNAILGTSQVKAAAEFSSFGYAWEYFSFAPPLDIAPSTNYWAIINSTGVSGTLYARMSAAAATSKHVYDDSGWSLESNKKLLHQIRASLMGQRVAADIVRFFRLPEERIKLIAPAIPQLQLMDEVLVDVSLPVVGRYRIAGRKHSIRPESYITTDTLEKV